MIKFHLDFETRSTVDLQRVGAWAYALHPSTEIMCMTVAQNAENIVTFGGPRFDWRNAGPQNGDWVRVVVAAHNVQFEYAIYNLILHRRYGWPARWDPSLWNCTLARAAQVGLPLSLDVLGRALQIKTPKDLDGRRVMHQLCRPTGVDVLGDPVYDDDPEKWARLLAYNRTDVLAAMEVDALLPALTPGEREVWEFDLAVNRRGVKVDTALAQKAAQLADEITFKLNTRLRDLTGNEVDKATRVLALKRWLVRQGLKEFESDEKEDSSLDKAAMQKLLDRKNITPLVKEVISIRQQVGKSSTAKYERMALAASPGDKRVRGMLQYHAAHTGRWGGRIIQPQNYPQGLKSAEQFAAISAIMKDTADEFAARYGDRAMTVLSDTLRGTIVAGEGKVLVCADFSAIEACVEMWLAEEKAALALLSAGKKPYIDLARDIFNNPALTKEKNPQEYELGKRAFLGYGYGMGAEKFQATVYNETAKVGKPLEISDELAERTKNVYREKYGRVVRMWYATESAAISAVKNSGRIYPSSGGRVLWGLSKDRRFLVAKLPSGRFLWYWKPEIKMLETPWGEKKETLCYWGEDSKTHQWSLLKTYGGALVENVTQAIARDLMAHGMMNVEKKTPGLKVLLTVHDEVLAEIDEKAYKDKFLDSFISALCDKPGWAVGCPVNAEGWVGVRYHK